MCKPNEEIINNSHWVTSKPTPDQQEIFNYLIEIGIKGKRILHVGIGNSSIASNCNGEAVVHGVTLSKHEASYGRSLNIKNYKVIEIDKYSDGFAKQLSIYDIIIDNNIASYACCREDFDKYIKVLFNSLKKDSVLYGHTAGWEYSINSGFSIKQEEVEHILEKHGFQFEGYNPKGSIIAIKKI